MQQQTRNTDYETTLLEKIQWTILMVTFVVICGEIKKAKLNVSFSFSGYWKVID